VLRAEDRRQLGDDGRKTGEATEKDEGPNNETTTNEQENENDRGRGDQYIFIRS
jgi:hypothetical protein